MRIKEEKRKRIKRKNKMIKKQEKKSEIGEIIELLKKLLIIELGKTGMPQRDIRKVVGIDINKVNRLVKHIKRKK